MRIDPSIRMISIRCAPKFHKEQNFSKDIRSTVYVRHTNGQTDDNLTKPIIKLPDSFRFACLRSWFDTLYCCWINRNSHFFFFFSCCVWAFAKSRHLSRTRLRPASIALSRWSQPHLVPFSGQERRLRRSEIEPPVKISPFSQFWLSIRSQFKPVQSALPSHTNHRT